MTPYGDIDLDLGKGLLLNDTKPLPDQLLTYYQ